MSAASTPAPGAQALDALLTEAGALRRAGRYADAELLMARAAALAPTRPEVLGNHGLLLSELGRHAEAARRQREALALDARFVPAWLNLALALQALGDEAGAAEARAQALALEPGSPVALVQQGLAWLRAGRPGLALPAFRDALRRAPGMPEAWIDLGLAQLALGDAPAARQAFLQALQRAPHDRRAASNLLMGGQYHDGLDSAALRADAERAGACWGRPPAAPRPAPLAGRRLRVGYLGADLRAHPVGWLLAPVLAGHDRRTVEVHVFDVGVTPADAQTAVLRAAAEHWHAWPGRDDATLARDLRAAALDVLVELGGHTEGGRLGVLALRPAPVQLSWLGYFGSTGLAAVDAVVLGSGFAPPGAEAGYTEPLERLPRPHLAYRPPPRPPRAVPRAAGPGVVFGSFNNPAKLSATTVALWAEVLRAVPGSTLVLKWSTLTDPLVAETLRRRFGERGVAAARLQLRGASPHAAMLAEYADIDIALDPTPFSGLTTSLEALAMGVPVLTMPGTRPVSRQTAALLGAMGLDGPAGLVADSPQAFVERAAALAADAPGRARWRGEGPEGLRARLLASPLADGAGLARELEALYRRRCEGRHNAADTNGRSA